MNLKKFVSVCFAICVAAACFFKIEEIIAGKFSKDKSPDSVTYTAEEESREEASGWDGADNSAEEWTYELNLAYENPLSGEFFNGWTDETNTGEVWPLTFTAFYNQSPSAVYYIGNGFTKISFDLAVCRISKDCGSWGRVYVDASDNGEKWMTVYSSENWTEVMTPKYGLGCSLPSGTTYVRLRADTDDYFCFSTGGFTVS